MGIQFRLDFTRAINRTGSRVVTLAYWTLIFHQHNHYFIFHFLQILIFRMVLLKSQPRVKPSATPSYYKYVHSDFWKWSCVECEAKFKQKRDMRAHMLKIRWKKTILKTKWNNCSSVGIAVQLSNIKNVWTPMWKLTTQKMSNFCNAKIAHQCLDTRKLYWTTRGWNTDQQSKSMLFLCVEKYSERKKYEKAWKETLLNLMLCCMWN